MSKPKVRVCSLLPTANKRKQIYHDRQQKKDKVMIFRWTKKKFNDNNAWWML